MVIVGFLALVYMDRQEGTRLIDSCENGWDYSETDDWGKLSGEQPDNEWFVEGNGSLHLDGGDPSGDSWNKFEKRIDLSGIENIYVTVKSDGRSANNPFDWDHMFYAEIRLNGEVLWSEPTSHKWVKKANIDASDYGENTLVSLVHIYRGTFTLERMGDVWFDNMRGWIEI